MTRERKTSTSVRFALKSPFAAIESPLEPASRPSTFRARLCVVIPSAARDLLLVFVGCLYVVIPSIARNLLSRVRLAFRCHPERSEGSLFSVVPPFPDCCHPERSEGSAVAFRLLPSAVISSVARNPSEGFLEVWDLAPEVAWFFRERHASTTAEKAFECSSSNCILKRSESCKHVVTGVKHSLVCNYKAA
jgi:hypothetical protein